MQENKKKILIVDEDTNYISGLRKGLSEAGHEVVYWDDSKKALELSKNISPDIIIADVNLPPINGHTFYNVIKDIPETRNIPFVFLSNQKRVDDRIKSMELGVDDFINKPFYVDEVIARIENLLTEVTNLEDSKNSNEKGFSGDISEMNLIDLIQTLELAKKSGVIKLKYNNFVGSVFINNGVIIDATLDDLPSNEALLRLAVWTEGSFSVEMTNFERNKTLDQNNKDLISEAGKYITSWEDTKKDLPPLNTVISVNQFSLKSNNTTEDEKILLSSLNGNQKLYDIIINSPLDDLKALKLVDNLYKRGCFQESTDSVAVEPENYLTQIKKDKNNSKKGNNRISYIISNLLHSCGEDKELKHDRRRDERRQFYDRRRFDRRKDRRTHENKIYLNKSELLLIREKLV